MDEISCGVVYIAVGDKAEKLAERSADALPSWIGKHIIYIAGVGSAQMSRDLKTRLYDLSKWEYTLYLDADTIPYGDVSAGFEIVRSGWDMVITFSDKQGEDCLWHLESDERILTFRELGRVPLQLQAGVFFFRRSEAVKCFFSVWRSEWERFRGQDQGAFLRALERAPLRIWLLGRPWNGGAIIAHRYGEVTR
jgi:hypothetical protein